MSIKPIGCGNGRGNGTATVLVTSIVQPVIINPDEHLGSLAPAIAAEVSLSALRVVIASPTTGKLIYADPNNADHAFRVIGLLTNAVIAESETQPLIRGVVTDSSWVWSLDQPVWLGANGTLTQNPTGSAFIVVVATVIDAQTLNFELQEVNRYG